MIKQLIDPFGREVNYLRVSVTDRCDFRCTYCMSENMEFLPKKDILTLEEIEDICNCFIDLGTKKIRLTGGEPLVRKGVFQLIENQSCFVPIKSRHRLSNPGKTPLIIIEVQSGGYLGEDDIVRFEDNYGRKSK